jgi:multidrug efflux pump subunit AcrB
MRNLIHFFIKRPIWTNAFIAVIIMFGLFTLSKLNSSFFPELDPKTITIQVMYPGASPLEMEEGITIKIEQAIKGLKDIEHINSTSGENVATITINAFQDADMDELLSDVENSVNSINSFPQGAEKPIIRRLKTGGMSSTVAIVGISSKNPDMPPMQLREKAIEVENQLLDTKVITQLIKSGFPASEIVISIRENDLLRYGLSMEQVAQAVGSKNIDITAGQVRGSDKDLIIRSTNRTTDTGELGDIIIRTTATGETVYLKDVADIVYQFSEDSELSRFNGQPAIVFNIEKTTDEDLSEIAQAVKDFQKSFNAANPDFHFQIFYEFSEMLSQRIDLLSENGIMGLVLVLVCLGIFLNLKLSAWVAFGIPFSFLGMFIIGYWYGMTINMISLFGMILVVGILVDDGIVIAENIFTHYERGKSAPKAALEGTMEVLPSVFTSVVTTIVAFSMLLFIEGMEMMREMAVVVIACLGFSLFEAFFILPSHLASKHILAEEKTYRLKTWMGIVSSILGILVVWVGAKLLAATIISLGGVLFPFTVIIIGAALIFTGFSASPVEHYVRIGAEKMLGFFRDKVLEDMLRFMNRKWLYRLFVFLPLVFLIFAVSSMMSGKIGFTFFPNIQPDMFFVEAAYKPGENKRTGDHFLEVATQIVQEENQRIIDETGDTLMSYYSSNVGSARQLNQFGLHAASLTVFCDAEGKKASIDVFMNRVLERLKDTPEAKLANDFVVTGMNRWGKPVEFGLSSANNASLDKAREYFKAELAGMQETKNVVDNMPPGKNEIFLHMRPQADIFGIGQAEILRQIRQGFFGQEAQRVIIGTDEVKIWVRYPREDRNSVAGLENMRIKTPSGMEVPLKELCDYTIGSGPESLKRRDGKRQVKVEADVINPNETAEVNRKIREEIIPQMGNLFPDVEVFSLGQAERSQKTSNSMQFMTMIILAIMIIIITLHFQSLYQSLMIMMVIPSGIAGAIIGHGIVGIPVSLLSVFGMIALIGVLVNDAVVFLDRNNQLILEGYSSRDAAIEASRSRFRPILLTTVTTVAGLLPLIAEKSMQAQFLIPMAVSIAFGVLFGTLMILVFFPSALLFGNDFKRTFRWLWTGIKPSHTDVETALNIRKKIHEIESYDAH